MGAPDLQGVAGRATAQDRHARADERYSLLAAHRLPVPLSARDGFPPRSTVYNIFRAGASRGSN
jgi:hypothetical protein